MSETETISIPPTVVTTRASTRRIPWDPAASRRKPPMAYTDFDLPEVVQQFKLKLTQTSLMEAIPPHAPTPWLSDTLQLGRLVAYTSEKSRSEFIVAPILLTCRELQGPECALHSGIRLDVDAEKGLRGECDFILAHAPQLPILQAPLLVVVEAKKQDIEEGLGQCAAQMVAAHKFNEQQGKPRPRVFGCVTSGETWQFLRLEGDTLVIDAVRYYLGDIEKILGILLAIVSERA